jgi:nitric oxide dioxygenase
MTDYQVKLIQRSWQQILPESNKVAKTFYQLLFAQHPELVHLFPSNFELQVKKMADTIEAIVSYLDRLDVLLPQVQLLGVRHAYYQVKLEHYAIVKQAMLQAMKQHLQDQWSDEMANAWEKAYDLLADAMYQAQVNALLK